MADKKIGGRYFRIGDLLATEGIKLQVRLIKLVGPAIESLPQLFAARNTAIPIEEDIKARSVATAAISKVFAAADPDEVASFIETVCELAMVSDNGKTDYEQVVFDHHFSGSDVKDIYPLTLFVLQETLGDFFTGSLGIGNLPGLKAD